MSAETVLKSIVKPLIPAQMMQGWRRFRFEREQSRDRGRTLKAVFEEIYATNAWAAPEDGKPFSSGPGSAAGVSDLHERFVVDYLMRHPEAVTLVDIGCGDFQVSGRILDRLAEVGRTVRYIGCDIAANVIAYNNATHARPGVEFRVLDVSREVPPAGDIVTVREVFQHLSNDVILAAIANLREVFDRAIVTESVHTAAKNPNVDLVSGYRTRDGLESGVFVELRPFSLPVLEEATFDWTPVEQLRTTLVALR